VPVLNLHSKGLIQWPIIDRRQTSLRKENQRSNTMKLNYIKATLIFSTCILMLLLMGCAEDVNNFLTNLDDIGTPTITEFESDSDFGGAEAVITGTGFSTDPSKNLITFGPHDNFGYKSIRPSSATATSLTFTKPVISAVDDNIFTEVRVSRLDDSDPVRSNALDVTFAPLISTFASGLVRPRAIAFDAAGDGYIAEYDVDNLRVVKVTAAGNEDYSIFPATNLRGEIEFDSQGTLWVATAWQALYAIAPGGGDPVDTGWTGDDAGRYFKSLSFDADDNLYGCLEGCSRMAPDGTETALDLNVENFWPGFVTTVADGYLYWYTKSEGEGVEGFYKAPLTADGIGAIETILELEPGNYWPNSIVVDTDGNIYGTGGGWDNANPSSIWKIAPDGTESVVYELGIDSCWGLEFHGEYIYVATQYEGTVLKCYMNGAVGAGR